MSRYRYLSINLSICPWNSFCKLLISNYLNENVPSKARWEYVQKLNNHDLQRPYSRIESGERCSAAIETAWRYVRLGTLQITIDRNRLCVSHELSLFNCLFELACNPIFSSKCFPFCYAKQSKSPDFDPLNSSGSSLLRANGPPSTTNAHEHPHI